jgi:GNAT superfamily N-acetyltransferase
MGVESVPGAGGRGTHAVVFLPSRSDEPPATVLYAQLDALFNEQYRDRGRAERPGSVTTPDEMAPPHGTFLVGYEGGRPVAIGGLRRLDERTCEIKRMYVVPEARSRGIGRALLAALEDAASGLGYRLVRLDAGSEQVHSRALFAATGYREIPPYNRNHIAEYFAEKDLPG